MNSLPDLSAEPLLERRGGRAAQQKDGTWRCAGRHGSVATTCDTDPLPGARDMPGQAQDARMYVTALRALILALGLLVLAAELINTAIEEVVDHISPGLDPRAKKAKDCGSACVALAAIAAGVAWVVGVSLVRWRSAAISC